MARSSSRLLHTSAPVRPASLALAGLAAVSIAGTASGAPSFTIVAAPAPIQGNALTAPLVQGPDGLLYTIAGTDGPDGRGSVLRIENDGSVTVVHAFAADGSEGKYPGQGLLLASDGWFYGTTHRGGRASFGTIFKVSTDGQFAVVHTFAPKVDRGAQRPSTALVQDAAGNFYGGVEAGGKGFGAVFKMTPDYQLSIVHAFTDKADGLLPDSLMLAPNGVIYGTTRYTHYNEGGAIFSIEPASGRFHTLHTFNCARDGCGPGRSMAAGPDKAIYGTTISGGNGLYAFGTAWRMSYKGAFSVMHVFILDSDPLGYEPVGGFVSDEAGKLYGTTQGGPGESAGTVYSMTRKGVGEVLHVFGVQGAPDGNSAGTPTVLAGGLVYGTTYYGGPYSPGGIVYEVEP